MGRSIWVFGYGSLIWGTGSVTAVERREGFLQGWHRDWAWISGRRNGAPTCSLKRKGRVKGVFLRLSETRPTADLEQFRRRERRTTEKVVSNVPVPGAKTYFWTMGSNLGEYREFRGLRGEQFAQAVAVRARRVRQTGPDGVTAIDYIRKVHEFDPEDSITARIAAFLESASGQEVEGDMESTRTGTL
jgi:cation transport regulator ChaC